MMKMQKRRIQRMEADARKNGVTAQWAQPNSMWERPMHRPPMVPMRNDNEVGGPTAPPQKKTPILKSVVAKPTVRLDLEACLKALEAVVKHSQEESEKLQKTGDSSSGTSKMWPIVRGVTPQLPRGSPILELL